MTLSSLRNAAKVSPVEHELVCPNRHELELRDGDLFCDRCFDSEPLIAGVDDGETVEVPWRWHISDCVRSGRMRLRQFDERGREVAFT